MPKPDPVLLDPARYPFRTEIEPRFSDLDVNLHINNVALVDILQEGRVRFQHAVRGEIMIEGATSMAVSLALEYLAQARHPQPLTIHVAVSHVGRTSQVLSQLVVQGGVAVAYAQVVLVFVRDDRPVEVPASYREAVRSWMLQA